MSSRVSVARARAQSMTAPSTLQLARDIDASARCPHKGWLTRRHPVLAALVVSLLLAGLLVGAGAVAAAEQRRIDARRRTDVVGVIDELTQDVITHNWA